MSHPHCPLCQSNNHALVYDLRQCVGGHRIPGEIRRCRACGFWFKIPADVQRVRDSYRDDYAADDIVERYMLSEPTRAYFRKIIAAIATNGGRLLDIGTGLGTFVEEAGKAGFDAQGLDLCEPLVKKARARGLNVQCKPAEELSSEEKFDVVTMMDIIEHVPEPLLLLASARRVLKPGGELVVYTPNHRGAVVVLAKCLNAMGAGFAIREIFGGNHVGFFDDRTLPAALRKSGFEIRAMRLFPYDPSRPGQPVSPLSLAAVTAIEQLGKPFGRMFRMLVYARSQP
jgi:2-polyprenyl-3-methyl-5-hydroxy-6-metoxy-1,4-benzoquinol methylase